MIFWEWKTGRIKSRVKAHSKVVITHEWLPHETVSCFHPTYGVDVNHTIFSLTFSLTQSKVITASWDGLIKLWVSVFETVFRDEELRNSYLRCVHSVGLKLHGSKLHVYMWMAFIPPTCIHTNLLRNLWDIFGGLATCRFSITEGYDQVHKYTLMRANE
jgi:hypothetical protein